MSDAIANAAIAFDQDMGSPRPAAPNSGINERRNAPEPIFGNSDGHEEDIVAGGDNTLAPGEKVRKAKKETPEPDVDTDDPFLYQDEEEDGEDDLEAEGNEEEPDADEDEDEEEALLAREFNVMVDGEEQTVPLKEALEGYIRTQTFHKRLNQLDGARKEIEKHATKVVEDRKRHDDMLAEAEEILKAVLPEEPNWDQLFAEDPKAARELQKRYDDYKGKVAAIQAKRNESVKQQQERALQEQAEFAKQEFPKFASQARWRDKEQMTKDINSMNKTGRAVGFSDEELAQVFDSRMLTVLLKASKYDRMMAAKPKPVKDGKKPVSPGAGSKVSTARRGVNSAQKKLARSGSVEDAANVFAKIIS